MDASKLGAFLIFFGIALASLLFFAFEINVWWVLTFTELGEKYNAETIPIHSQWEVFFEWIWLDLIITIPIALFVAFIVAIVMLDGGY